MRAMTSLLIPLKNDMNFTLLHSFTPSLTTLTASMLVPALYFVVERQFAGDRSKMRFVNALGAAVSVLLIGVVTIKSLTLLRTNHALLHLAFLHLIPAVTLLLIIAKDRNYRSVLKLAIGGGNPGADTGGTPYQPRPEKRPVKSMTWDDLIISDDLRIELMAVVELLKDPRTTAQYGIETPKGILLSGPPGTGKTTLAKVMANIAGLSFFVLSMDEIVSQWVGQSEKNLSLLFRAAEKAAPSVIFIDEVDAIGRGRSSGQDAWAENLLNHLLQLIDGVVNTEGLYIIAATNRADLVDSALKRSGRLNKTIEVGLPNPSERHQLFQLFLSKLRLKEDVNIERLVQATQGKSGADIKEICNQAGMNAFKRESFSGGQRDYLVSKEDLVLAVAEHLREKAA